MSRYSLAAVVCLFAAGFLTGCGTTNSTAPVAGPQGPVGPAGLIFKGAYNPATAYVPTDVVTWQGSSYVAINPISVSASSGPPSTPANSADWAVLAQAGATGAQGPVGLQGVQGPQGIAGATGPVGPQGVAGPQGMAGLIGPAGAAGLPGPMGPMGPAGPQGAAGPPGIQGPAGPAGSGGLAGATGSTGPIGPQGPPGAAGPSGPTGPAGAAGTNGTNMASFLQGRQLGIQGDSFTAFYGVVWEPVVVSRTGMTVVNQDARPARDFPHAFECYRVTTPGMPLGIFDATVEEWGGGTCGGAFSSLGNTAGNTLAQNISNVDIELIELGTNDQNYPLGNLGDPVDARTYYGNMRWVVETYLSAKPTLRVVLVTLEYNLIGGTAPPQAFAEATVAYGKSMGIPVINMYALSGTNVITASTLLQPGGIHPTVYAFANFYGPVVAQGLQQIF